MIVPTTWLYAELGSVFHEQGHSFIQVTSLFSDKLWNEKSDP